MNGITWTCIGFFGTPRHDMCKGNCTCPCHGALRSSSEVSHNEAVHSQSGMTE